MCFGKNKWEDNHIAKVRLHHVSVNAFWFIDLAYTAYITVFLFCMYKGIYNYESNVLSMSDVCYAYIMLVISGSLCLFFF